MNPLADASAHKVATTLERTIVPDPIPADAEKVLPYELARYEENGYGKWSYGPGLAAERRLDLMPAGVRRRGGRRRRQAPALLRHHRHPHHRRAVAGPGDLLRLQGLSLVGLLGRHALHAPRARRGRADGQRPAPARSRSTSASPWATRATTPSTTSCAGTSTSSTASASTPTPGSKAGDVRRTARRVPRRLRGGRARPGHPLVPGARQPRPLLDGLPAGRRLPAQDLRRRGDPRTSATSSRIRSGPDSRGFYMGCLDGRTPYGDIFGIGPVAGFPTPPKVLAADPDRRSLTKSEWMSEFFDDLVEPEGHGFDEADRRRRLRLLRVRAEGRTCRSGSSSLDDTSATTTPTTTATGTSRSTRSGTTGSSASWTAARPTACS